MLRVIFRSSAAVSRLPAARVFSSKNDGTDVFRNAGTMKALVDEKEKKEELLKIETEEELQPYWASMEKRVLQRTPRKIGPRGRLNKHESAWDAENV